MSKIHRGGRSAEGEPLSAGRVEYLEAARARARAKHIRRTVIIVAALTIVILFATGVVGSSIARAKDLVDSVHIALTPASGWPQQTGITDPDTVVPMSGSFVDSTIALCAVANAGQVAVVTDSTDSAAKLTVYNSAMEQALSWNLTSEQGTPLRMAFSPDSRRLAVAAVTATGGQLTTNLYALPLSQGDPVQLGTEASVPQWMGWMSNGFLLVLYENRAVLYNTTGGSIGERASYDFGGATLVSVSAGNSGAALLLSSGQTCTAVLLDGELQVGYSGSVPAANHIVLAQNDGFYLLTDSTVERFDHAGQFQWSQTLPARPQALLEGKQILVFTGNTVQVVTPPEEASSSQ